MQGPFADHILDARDVCSNCYQVVRVERIDPTRTGFAGELESSFERRNQTTTVEYAPHEYPPRSKGVFCECGVEGAHERLWDPTDISDDRFKSLIKNAVRSLRRKGVTLKPKETAAVAIQRYRKTEDADRALATGIDAGIHAAVAAGDIDSQPTPTQKNDLDE